MGVCQSQEEKDMVNKTREIDRELQQVPISLALESTVSV
jgi:hypothetical protein